MAKRYVARMGKLFTILVQLIKIIRHVISNV